MLTTSPSSMQLILRTERDLQGPWVQDGEGKLSPPLSQLLPVGKPSAMWVSSSGPAGMAMQRFWKICLSSVCLGDGKMTLCRHKVCCIYVWGNVKATFILECPFFATKELGNSCSSRAVTGYNSQPLQQKECALHMLSAVIEGPKETGVTSRVVQAALQKKPSCLQCVLGKEGVSIRQSTPACEQHQ